MTQVTRESRLAEINEAIAKIKTSEEYKHWLSSKGIDPEKFLPMLLKTKESLEKVSA